MSLPRSGTTFGFLLREHRLAAGLTQEALSERSGISPRTIQQLEADSVRPRRSTALNLAQALDLSDQERVALERTVTGGMPRRRLSDRADSSATRVDGNTVVAMPLPHEELVEPEREIVMLPRPHSTNVPWPIASLLGRDADLEAIRNLLTSERQRMVTLIGLGGSGKTRLAVEVALGLVGSFADGVWLVELAPASDAALVPRIVAGTLGVREIQDAGMVDGLIRTLRRKRALLVLDNCEHLIDAVADLAQRLLTGCPELHILATSREPLQIAGERRWQVRPLAVPDLDRLHEPAAIEALASIPSVQLFGDRAQAIDADFALGPANAVAVATICARLDGIPLAIELAASRMAVLTAAQIAQRLDESFRVLAARTRDRPTRQQTMQATLDWSYDMLAEGERAAFRALSAFAGGFDLAAAEAIVGDGSWVIGDRGGRGAIPPSPITQPLRGGNIGYADIPSPIALDLLGRLVDKSLVLSEQTSQGRRYRLLEPVREYARDTLLAAGEEIEARSRHADYFCAFAERANPHLRGPEQVQWMERLEGERNNLRAALGWSIEHGDLEVALRLGVALGPYWEGHGYLSEGRHWLDIILAQAHSSEGRAQLQMEGTIAAGALAMWQGDFSAAESLLDAALVAARALGDRRNEGEALNFLSPVAWHQDTVERGLALGEQALALGRQVGDQHVIGVALMNVGMAAYHLGDIDRALSVLAEGLEHNRNIGHIRYIGIAHTVLGRAILSTGDHEKADAHLREGALVLRTIGDLRFLEQTFAGFVYVAAARNDPRRAVIWRTVQLALREELGLRKSQRVSTRDQELQESLRRQLTPADYDDAVATGAAMRLDQALAEIFDEP